MRIVLALAALAGLSGCASAPLDEAERTRVRVVAPAAARFAPAVEFRVPPGKAEGAATAGVGVIGAGAAMCMLITPFFFPCLALVAPPAMVAAGAAFGAAATPSNEGIEAMTQHARGQLGASDVQQLLVQRFSERVARLTSHRIVPDALKLGPQSHSDTPSYSSAAESKGAIVAEVAVEWVGATLVEPFELFGADYAARPLRVEVRGRIRLVRPTDGATLVTRYYSAARYAGRIQEYEHDGAKILLAVARAVEEVAILMVDDAFLLRSASFAASGPAVTALEPLPSGPCLSAPSYGCWSFNRVPTLDTVSPSFRWRLFPEPRHLEAAPWLRSARNLVYDLWIFGGDDDRIVDGLTSTEHTLERPLTHCRRYSWAVRARFDTDAGPRAVEWSTASVFPRRQLQTGSERPTFGAPFITPCPAG